MMSQVARRFFSHIKSAHPTKNFTLVETPDNLNEVGKALYGRGLLDPAIDAFRKALSVDPEFAQARYNLAYALASTSRTTEAEQEYRRAIALDPDRALAHELQILPLYVQIETIRACNAACIMCPLEGSPVPNKVMTDELFERVVTQITALPAIPTVGLFGLGEPFLDKRLEQRIRFAKSKGIRSIILTTNASLLTAERAQQVLSCGGDVIAQIIISLESIDKKVFETIRVGLDLDVVLDNTINLISIRNRIAPRVPISLMYLYSDLNRNELLEYAAFWRKYLKSKLDTISCQPIHSFGKFDMQDTNNFSMCYQLFTDMHIRADGTVSLCCIDIDSEYPLGRIQENSIVEIYNSKKMRSYRHQHLLGKRHCTEICGKCDQPEAARRTVTFDIQEKIPILSKTGYYILA